MAPVPAVRTSDRAEASEAVTVSNEILPPPLEMLTELSVSSSGTAKLISPLLVVRSAPSRMLRALGSKMVLPEPVTLISAPAGRTTVPVPPSIETSPSAVSGLLKLIPVPASIVTEPLTVDAALGMTMDDPAVILSPAKNWLVPPLPKDVVERLMRPAASSVSATAGSWLATPPAPLITILPPEDLRVLFSVPISTPPLMVRSPATVTSAPIPEMMTGARPALSVRLPLPVTPP